MANREDRYFCFRFDVDTHRCLREGVPNLLSIFDELDVRATFFVTPGRAVSVQQFLKKIPFDKSGERRVAKLSRFSKLGFKGMMIASCLNPEVGRGHPERVRQIEEEGHEVAVHGGGNHAEWMYNAHNWDQTYLREEVRGGLNTLREIISGNPRGFGSPGWNAPEGLPDLLFDLGFDYMADRHGVNEESVVRPKEGPVSIPTNLVGEPGGVGYLESLRAQDLSNKQIMERFRNDLLQKQQIATFFEHPFYAGVQELDLLREIVSIVRELDYTILRFDELMDLPQDATK